MTVEEGSMAPDARYLCPDGSEATIAAHRGRPLVLWFYPKDDTSGCTSEAKAFSERAADFRDAGVALLGISRDPPKSHLAFIDKHALTVPLGTDEDGSVTEAFGVWVEKNMYGKRYMGIERATFLIDAEGRVARAWRKVKVPGHAEAVLAAAQALG
ncbi:peroxiredoxin Q/BCP [Sphingomonas jejuensis]|uniref:thioredoxin-dependent peroxiredoxin n=1 Tax=Sphingomonas jejuensis TaxID=904715 RepID=A0ABX0XHI2_9SPHN|nr:peroxiredoxin [Sphingomonas jejuensis]NJC32680.1 peroxiredoxin Q/BCP [Sphingomonas jejuensis]